MCFLYTTFRPVQSKTTTYKYKPQCWSGISGYY